MDFVVEERQDLKTNSDEISGIILEQERGNEAKEPFPQSKIDLRIQFQIELVFINSVQFDCSTQQIYAFRER